MSLANCRTYSKGFFPEKKLILQDLELLLVNQLMPLR